MSTKAVADLWSLSSQRVAATCKDGRVVGACKDLNGHYIISVDTKKPLDKETIRTILISLLAMKNRPGNRLIMKPVLISCLNIYEILSFWKETICGLQYSQIKEWNGQQRVKP